MTLSACSDSPTQPGSEADLSAAELSVATFASTEAEMEASREGANAGRLLGRVRNALRNTDNAEARGCLARAAELRRQARAAREAGDTAQAREFMQQSINAVLCAVVAVFPEAPARIGEIVDTLLARIDARVAERFGDQQPPERLVRVLNHVRELRTNADSLLAEGMMVPALHMNLRAMHILRRLVHHIRNRTDREDDGDADQDMNDETDGSV